ncbi:hypothetical protein GRI69_11760 [Erythrobacter vulgaris]|uniref:PD-(D/E)XK nuclease family protein n=1 Tax=Qipengyuania vulgaris TaxID=291985 RepID=A0A844XUW9_9SPHN|nr:PD-(D/E)XK nuclease family protein [Qipengyuania vulgaris]MXO48933.1 hypothetical protein [Qipengyuania vulgaris]
MTTEHLNLARLPRRYRPAPLKVWSEHLQDDTQKAVRRLVTKLASVRPAPGKHLAALKEWFGITDEHHCFIQRVEPWLALTETQAMAGLQHFLEKHGEPAILAFLRAAAPGQWPDKFDDCAAEIEVVIPSKGSRIDMIVSGQEGDRYIGVVIEAKLGAALTNNPLSDYRAFAKRRGLISGVGPTRLLILDIGHCRETEKRLKRNDNWSLLSWHVLLVRLEKELPRSGILDRDFAALRHHIWRRL